MADSSIASANSPLYAGRRRRNAIAKGLALAKIQLLRLQRKTGG